MRTKGILGRKTIPSHENYCLIFLLSGQTPASKSVVATLIIVHLDPGAESFLLSMHSA